MGQIGPLAGGRAGRPPGPGGRRSSSKNRAGASLLRVAVPRRCLLGEADCCEGDVDDVELFRERLDHDAEALDAVLQELLAQRGAEHLEPALAEVGDGRDLGKLKSRPGRPLDVAQKTLLARFDERDRDALAPGATRPADAVDVRLGFDGMS